jgi:hypothetical protein
VIERDEQNDKRRKGDGMKLEWNKGKQNSRRKRG